MFSMPKLKKPRHFKYSSAEFVSTMGRAALCRCIFTYPMCRRSGQRSPPAVRNAGNTARICNGLQQTALRIRQNCRSGLLAAWLMLSTSYDHSRYCGLRSSDADDCTSVRRLSGPAHAQALRRRRSGRAGSAENGQAGLHPDADRQQRRHRSPGVRSVSQQQFESEGCPTTCLKLFSS
jgi:hypothetical protein